MISKLFVIVICLMLPFSMTASTYKLDEASLGNAVLNIQETVMGQRVTPSFLSLLGIPKLLCTSTKQDDEQVFDSKKYQEIVFISGLGIGLSLIPGFGLGYWCMGENGLVLLISEVVTLTSAIIGSLVPSLVFQGISIGLFVGFRLYELISAVVISFTKISSAMPKNKNEASLFLQGSYGYLMIELNLFSSAMSLNKPAPMLSFPFWEQRF